jgi:hypothetical protein
MSFFDLRPDQFKTDGLKRNNHADWVWGLGVCLLLAAIFLGGSFGDRMSDCEAENIRAIHEQAGMLKDSGQGQAGDNLRHNARRVAKSRC